MGGTGRGTGRWGWALAAAALALTQAGCVAFGWSSTPLTYVDERPAVQIVTTNVGGKNFFVPSTIVLTAGSGRKLSVFNTTDSPHGFQIPSLGVALVVPPGVETPVDLPPLEAGHIYAINCQLHPAHRGASLVVLPAATP